MDFEWGPEKNNRCYVERGFDVAYAALGFFDHDRITPRSNAIPIISARKANQKEVKQYEKTSHDD